MTTLNKLINLLCIFTILNGSVLRFHSNKATNQLANQPTNPQNKNPQRRMQLQTNFFFQSTSASALRCLLSLSDFTFLVFILSTPAIMISFSVFLFSKEPYNNILLARSSLGWGLLKTLSIDCSSVSALHFLLKFAFPLVNFPSTVFHYTLTTRYLLLYLYIIIYLQLTLTDKLIV